MRQQWRKLSEYNRKAGYWSENDAKELSDSIAEAINSKDEQRINDARIWLDAEVRNLESICRRVK